MLLQEETNNAPKINSLPVKASISFSPNNGEFRIYNIEKKERTELKEIKIIPINDSRMTVKNSDPQDSARYWSGVYRSLKQNITVMQTENGKTSRFKTGKWSEDLKPTGKLTLYQVVYCMLELDGEWVLAEFLVSGVSMVQWRQNVSEGDTDGVVTLATSDDKTFVTPSSKKFYEFTVKSVAQDIDYRAAAASSLEAVTTFFKENDAHHDFYKNEDAEEEVDMDAELAKQEQAAEEILEDIDPEDIPF